MNNVERTLIKERERKFYRNMTSIAKIYGRLSEEFQVARARWFSYYELCSELGIVVVDNDEV